MTEGLTAASEKENCVCNPERYLNDNVSSILKYQSKRIKSTLFRAPEITE